MHYLTVMGKHYSKQKIDNKKVLPCHYIRYFFICPFYLSIYIYDKVVAIDRINKQTKHKTNKHSLCRHNDNNDNLVIMIKLVRNGCTHVQ